MMEKNKKNRKRIALTAAAIAAAAAIGFGGAYAMYSAQSVTRKNNFTVLAGDENHPGAGDDNDVLKITETDWVEPKEGLTPGQRLGKNPVIENKSTYKGWVVVKVEVPTINAKLDGDEEAHWQDAVTLENNDKAALNTSLVGQPAGDTDGKFILLKAAPSTTENTPSVYYYGYNGLLAPNTSTGELFKNITVKKFTQVTKQLTGSVNVTARMVQNINQDTGVEYKDVSDAFKTGMNEGFEDSTKTVVTDY